MSVKAGLTAKRLRETPEYAGFARRAIRAYGRRVADADPEDLREMLEMRVVLEEAIATAVDGLRDRASWTDIARALGVSRQGAQQRYGGRPSPKAGGPFPGQLDLFS